VWRATTAIGPHYCPRDQTIYVDLGFFEQLQTRFGARGGDFAEAYVIAHEVGHHVQSILGIMEEVQQVQQDDASQANAYSVRLELQADCLAGTWGHSVFERDVLDPGDIEEGLDAAAAVGDDRIQQTMTGRVNPESWTHGSSEQRVEWFKTGYDTGDPNGCNTFG
jgi:predicted metalloprotease